MMTAANIRYELVDRASGLAPDGIGALHRLARRIGLIRAMVARLHLVKRHLPCHETDHVRNIAFDILAGGTRIGRLELRRNDEVDLEASGTRRIPDPTTVGDHRRRLQEADVVTPRDAIKETRRRVWSRQSPECFTEAIVDANGHLVETAAKTTPRSQLERIKPELVRERGFKTIHLLEEMVALLRVEFATFCEGMIQMPCPNVRGSRRLTCRLLSWNPGQGLIPRLAERLHGSWQN